MMKQIPRMILLLLFILILAACGGTTETTSSSVEEPAVVEGTVNNAETAVGNENTVGNEATVAEPTDIPPQINLPDLGVAPEITNDVWINTDTPITLASQQGKVVLVEFWTFG